MVEWCHVICFGMKINHVGEPFFAEKNNYIYIETSTTLEINNLLLINSQTGGI